MPQKKKFQTIKGMKDILPSNQGIWEHVINVCEKTALAYSFNKIETPIVESTSLFKRSVGAHTDIVQKEMFSFETQGGDAVSLRPEITASICRAYIGHGLVAEPKPVKLFQTGRCFRYERPQAGRFRQFYQFDVEIIGSGDASSDAEGIALAHVIFKELGLKVVFQVNSIGTPESRKVYIQKLKKFYMSKISSLCKDCQARYKSNPLRLLDCKKKKCSACAANAPQIVDFLDSDSKDHFMKTLEYLDDFDLPYELNPRIVRGLDYYTRTAFEVWLKDSSGAKITALGGGGRYDGLIEAMGGRATPAFGFALGLERIIAKIREKKIKPVKEQKFDIFLAHIGREAQKHAFKLFEELHAKGYNITFNLSKTSLRQQLQFASKANIGITLILGEKEVKNKEILIKEMDAGAQESIALNKLEKELQKRLK